jgi:phosphatidylglycerophosphate synthase
MQETEDRPTTVDAGIERRPLKSRQWGFSIALASRLARMGVSPNAVSLVGLAAGVLGGVALAATALDRAPWHFWLLGAACVQLRLLCNLIDGMIAVESGKRSPVGELYNEIPDRVSDGATLTGLGFAAGGDPWLGLTAAILAVFVAYVRAAVKIAGAPQDYCGPMAKPHRMFVVTVTSLLSAALPGWRIATAALALIVAGCVVTAIRRLARASRFLKARAS